MGLLSFVWPQVLARSGSRFNTTIEVIGRFGSIELYVNGIQQSGSYTVRLWKTAMTHLGAYPEGKVRKILILGVGGGTLFTMVRKRFPSALITGVDVDGEIIRLGKSYFGLGDMPRVSLVCRDARDYARMAKKSKLRFDLVILDLYIGNDVPEFVTDKTFLTDVKDLTASGGTVIFNYFCDRDQSKKSDILLDKLSQIYQSVVRRDIQRNKFFYCQ